MIDESFVQAAIKIRRDYLKITNNMDIYSKVTKDLLKNLTEISEEIEEKKRKIDNKEIKNSEEILKSVQKVLDDINDECKRMDESLKPLNTEMEKLLLEEAELWRKIKEKHYNINEDDIVNYVKNRLIQENLS